jgi:hypothetical protein
VRQRGLLAVSVPLAAIGCLAGHAVGYALVGTSRTDSAIHGYLGCAPQLAATCLALVTLSLALRVSGRLQGRPTAWPFAFLPPIAFLAQELIERLAAGLPAHAVFEPAVYAGLAAQVPIGVMAVLAARLLLRVADSAARTLARPSGFTPQPVALHAPAPAPILVRTPRAFDRLSRAPPLD